MSILVGHARIDENGKAHGGKAGDQKTELCTRNWYKGNWNYVLRPKNQDLAEKSASACEFLVNSPHVGYDQYQRNSLYQVAKEVGFDLEKIEKDCECDCSTLMHVCALIGGANLAYGSNGLTTRTMVNGFRKSGDYEVLSDKKYLTTDAYLKRGDILVKEGSHTIMALGNGTKVYENEPISVSYLAKTTSDLNLRSSASSANSKNIVAVIPKNTYVSVLADKESKWVQVQTIIRNKSYTGYVSKHYLSSIDISKNEKRKVTSSGLNARSGQNTSFPVVFTMKKDSEFTVIQKETWGLVLFNGKLGYANVSNTYSKKI